MGTTIVVQSDHGLYINDIPKDKKFEDISDSLIDHRLAAYTAVRGCKSNEAAKLNQANIVEHIVDCLFGRNQNVSTIYGSDSNAKEGESLATVAEAHLTRRSKLNIEEPPAITQTGNTGTDEDFQGLYR